MVVDVTRVQIQKPKVNQGVYYSAKDKFHALKFEVACTIANPRIVWVNGGFPGSQSDIAIARQGFILELHAHERVLADMGYIGEHSLWTPTKFPRVPAEVATNEKLNSIRQVIERVNQRIKIFRCLSSVWRHDFDFSRKCFNVVCKISNILFITKPINKM